MCGGSPGSSEPPELGKNFVHVLPSIYFDVIFLYSSWKGRSRLTSNLLSGSFYSVVLKHSYTKHSESSDRDGSWGWRVGLIVPLTKWWFVPFPMFFHGTSLNGPSLHQNTKQVVMEPDSILTRAEHYRGPWRRWRGMLVPRELELDVDYV